MSQSLENKLSLSLPCVSKLFVAASGKCVGSPLNDCVCFVFVLKGQCLRGVNGCVVNVIHHLIWCGSVSENLVDFSFRACGA